MLTYFIIIFVVALALAPLSHFLPSKRQRKVAGMREYAAVHGMFVEFRALPDVGGVPLSASVSGGQVIYYGRRFPNKRAGPIESGTWVHAPEGWRSLGNRLPVPAQLQALSVDISVASRRPIQLRYLLDGSIWGGRCGANKTGSRGVV